jgi:hypothetical protein
MAALGAIASYTWAARYLACHFLDSIRKADKLNISVQRARWASFSSQGEIGFCIYSAQGIGRV